MMRAFHVKIKSGVGIQPSSLRYAASAEFRIPGKRGLWLEIRRISKSFLRGKPDCPAADNFRFV
jgi:hypothetical protein